MLSRTGRSGVFRELCAMSVIIELIFGYPTIYEDIQSFAGWLLAFISCEVRVGQGFSTAHQFCVWHPQISSWCSMRKLPK